MRTEIIPAVIAKTPDELQRMLEKIGNHALRIQLDVMDGSFVPSASLHFPLPVPELPARYEAHLMVADPDDWIEKNNASVGMIIPHLESTADPRRTIRRIKGKGKKAAMALNPETLLERLIPLLDELDQVLIMTVNPGFYGSPFLPETLEKIHRLRTLRPNLPIEVDGGIKPATIRQTWKAGANLFVSGSYLLLAEDIALNIQTLRDLLI